MEIHTLHQWLRDEKLSAAAWGKLLGISRMSAARYARGVRVPPADVVITTYRLSRGRVRPDHWYHLPDLNESREAAA